MWHSLMKWKNSAVEILLVTLLTYEEGLQKQELYERVSPFPLKDTHLLRTVYDVAGLHLLYFSSQKHLWNTLKYIIFVTYFTSFTTDGKGNINITDGNYSWNVKYGAINAKN